MMTFVLTLAPAKMLYLNPIVTNGKPLATVESHCFYQRAYRPYRLFGFYWIITPWNLLGTALNVIKFPHVIGLPI